MAVKEKDTAKEPVVTRISAQDTSKPAKKAKAKTNVGQTRIQKKRLDPLAPVGIIVRVFGATGGYFKGAWFELRQVRWPNRRATWSMTGALLGFTAFFIVFILLIDALFKYLFKLMLG